jgi:hypothetical protein
VAPRAPLPAAAAPAWLRPGRAAGAVRGRPTTVAAARAATSATSRCSAAASAAAARAWRRAAARPARAPTALPAGPAPQRGLFAQRGGPRRGRPFARPSGSTRRPRCGAQRGAGYPPEPARPRCWVLPLPRRRCKRRAGRCSGGARGLRTCVAHIHNKKKKRRHTHKTHTCERCAAPP